MHWSLHLAWCSTAALLLGAVCSGSPSHHPFHHANNTSVCALRLCLTRCIHGIGDVGNFRHKDGPQMGSILQSSLPTKR